MTTPERPQERVLALTVADIDQIVEGIEEFIVSGDEGVREVWLPYINKLTDLRAVLVREAAAPVRAPQEPPAMNESGQSDWTALRLERIRKIADESARVGQEETDLVWLYHLYARSAIKLRVPAPEAAPQALSALLASIDDWLGNSEGLMNEDVIEWRNALAAAIGRPSFEENYQARQPAAPLPVEEKEGK